MSQSPDSRSALRVLVVEDEPLQRWMLCEELRDLGVGVVAEAEDGARALHIFEENRFDLVITDLNMPGMDGIGFLRVLAAIRWQCPVIITSALDDDLLHLVEEAMAESGCFLLDVLPKPVDLARLETLIDKVSSASLRPATHRARLDVTVDEVARALASGIFEPHFQPKVEIATGQVLAVESLARWHHPDKGWIPPSEFIPLLEQNGSIVELTFLLLRKVCASLRRLDAAGFHLRAAVNLSRALFSRIGVVEQISEIVAETGIPPDRLILEITETAVDDDPGNMLASLARLKMRGFKLSIDDFGTGYSSMQALVRVPFDELKIDRSFVTGATRNTRSRIVLEATVQLAARLGQRTVAEGVETREELELLTAVGCHQVQGYLFARPLPEPELLAWLLHQPALAL